MATISDSLAADSGHAQHAPRSRVDCRNSEAERRHLIDQARALIVADGHRCFSLDRMAGQFGIARATILRHFNDHHDLYRAVIVHLLDRTTALLPSSVTNGGTRREAIAAFAGEALQLLTCQDHRDLQVIVDRDSADLHWLASTYQDQINAPLGGRLEQILSVWQQRADGHPIAVEAHRAVALLRSTLASKDTALSIAEFAELIETRMTMARHDADHAVGLVPRDRERRPMIKRGAITLTFDPIEIRWNGRLAPLSSLEAQIFALVVQRGRVRWTEIDVLMARLGASVRSRDVMFHRIRRKFDRIGAANPIETVKGWGVRFMIEPDLAGARTILIGACESGLASLALQVPDLLDLPSFRHERPRQYHQ